MGGPAGTLPVEAEEVPTLIPIGLGGRREKGGQATLPAEDGGEGSDSESSSSSSDESVPSAAMRLLTTE